MNYSAKDINNLLGGEIIGNPDVMVSSLSKIEEGKPGTLTFLSNPKYAHFLAATRASVVVVSEALMPAQPVSATLIKVKDAYEGFTRLLEMYNKLKTDKNGIDKNSSVSVSAQIGRDVYVGAFAFVGERAQIGNNVKIFPSVYVGDDVSIGDNTILFPGVKVNSQCSIGGNCEIHSGTVIGSDGFGFTPQVGNVYKKVAQIGNVVIEDNVEIGANTTIDRATVGSTIIRKGVKLDNLIQIAHNVEIGENTVIAAQTGIAGSTRIGRDCMIGGQVGIAGHLTIADKVKIGAQSGIGADITKEGEIIFGSPAFGIREFQRSYVLFKNFPAIVKRIKELETAISELLAVKMK